MNEILRTYQEKYPLFFGALLDIFSKSLKHMKTVQLPIENCPRLIEFTRLGMAVADALRRVAPALRQMGIECRSLGKIGGYVSWEIRPIN